MGRSRGLGNLVRFELLPGQRFDTVGVATLINGITFGGLIADQAFGSSDIIADLDERGAKILISSNRDAPSRCHSTRNSTSSSTSSNTSSANSRSSNASPCALTNRPELRCNDLSLRRRHKLTMNLNKPKRVEEGFCCMKTVAGVRRAELS